MEELDALFTATEAIADPTAVVDLPRVYNGPDDKPWTVPFYEGVPPGTPLTSEVSSMPDPTVIPDVGNIYKATLRMNSDGSGMSENVLWHVVGVPDDLQAVANAMVGYIRERKKILHQNVKMVSLIIQNEKISGDGDRTPAPGLEMGVGAVTAAPAPLRDGFILECSDASSQIRSARGIGGLSYTDLSITDSTDDFRPVVSARVTTFVDAMKTLLTGNLSVVDGQTVRACLGGYLRGETNPLVDVAKWELDTNGLVKLTMASAVDWKRGDKVHISHRRSKCIRGLAGTYDVVSKTSVAGVGDVVVLYARLSCSADSLPGLIGTAQKRTPSYYYIDDVSRARYGRRVVGGPFYRSVGHRKAKGK